MNLQPPPFSGKLIPCFFQLSFVLFALLPLVAFQHQRENSVLPWGESVSKHSGNHSHTGERVKKPQAHLRPRANISHSFRAAIRPKANVCQSFRQAFAPGRTFKRAVVLAFALVQQYERPSILKRKQ